MDNIHDIANKPLLDLLKQQWSVSIHQRNLKQRQKMI